MILHLLLASAALAATPVDTSTAAPAAVATSTEAAKRPDPKTAVQEFVRGQLLERKGDYQGALAAYEAALKADPRSSYIDRQAAELSLEGGDGEKALAYAKAARELEPRDATTLTLLGKAYWAVGRPEEATDSFQQALKLDPKSSEAIYALAGLQAEHDPDQARRLLERYLQQNPDQASEARFQLAKIELQLGRTKAAEKQLKESIALSPDEESAQARYALAQAYESEHSTDAALGAYLDLLKLEPTNAALLDHVAELYFLKDDWESMRGMLTRAKESQNDDPTANHWLALDAEKHADWDAAIKYVKDSAALKDDPSLTLRLSYYLTQAGKLDEAIAVLDAHKKWPNNDQVEYFLALGYDDRKQSEKAVPLLRHVLTLKPQNHDARYQLGVILEKLGKLDQAEPEFRALLAENPDDASVLNYLGYSLADRGEKLDEAETYLEKAVSLEPKNGAYVDSLGWVHYKRGQYKQAVEELRKAVDLIGDDDQVWDHLGDAEFKAGDDFNAWRAWKRSESLMDSGAKLPGKAAQVERGMKPEELGVSYLDYLKLLQGGIKKITGVCDLNVVILKHPASYRLSFFTFRGPDELDVDLLGPMMMPVFRMRLAKDSFEMDPLKIEGVDPRAVTDGAYEALTLMRAYLSGAIFDARPAVFKKTWRKRFIETPEWRFMLDRGAVRIEKVIPLKQSQYQLSLDNFGRTEGGRQVPRTFTVEGPGFSLSLRFDSVKMTFTGNDQ